MKLDQDVIVVSDVIVVICDVVVVVSEEAEVIVEVKLVFVDVPLLIGIVVIEVVAVLLVETIKTNCLMQRKKVNYHLLSVTVKINLYYYLTF